MSKNFEQEYKEHIANDVPDLWAGIEARLPEKKNTKIVWWRNTKVLGSVAALVVLIGSAAVYMKFYPLTGLGNAMSEAPAADSAADVMPNEEYTFMDGEAAVAGDAAEEAISPDSPAEFEGDYESMSDTITSESVKGGTTTSESVRNDASFTDSELEFNGITNGADMSEDMNAWNDTDLNIWDAEVTAPEVDYVDSTEKAIGLEFEIFAMVDDVWMKDGVTYYHVTLQEDVPVWELVTGEGINFCADEEFTVILECGETYRLRVANYEASENDRGSIEDYKIVGWRK